MRNNPLVSVIMNCYNSDEFLKEAIESVIYQTYQDLEIIFWDNRSTDNSATIVNSYKDKRIKYFYAEEFTSLGKARNLAIAKSSGQWIAFLDCDDIWELEKLELSFEVLQKREDKENISLIYSKSLTIDRKGDILLKNSKAVSGQIHDLLLKDENFIVFSSIILKKDIFLENGKIDESLNFCEDYDILLKITKNYYGLGINAYLTNYRIHGKNISLQKVYDNNIETVKLLENYILKNKPSFNIRIHILINNSYRLGSAIIKLILNKEYLNSLTLVKTHKLYLLFFPFSVIYKKIRLLQW